MILIIDNYDSFTYNLYQDVAQWVNAVTVVRNDAFSLTDIAEQSPNGIILSPGPGRPESAGLCIDVIQRFSGQIPILGVCLGHQAIATAFGGQVIQSTDIMHGKTSLVFHNRGRLYQDLPLPLEVGRYHSLVVDRTSLPECLMIEAETADQTIMGIRHQQHLTFGVQFHPESILTDNGSKLIDNFLSLCQQEALIC